MDADAILQRRLLPPPWHWLEARTTLRHFALINYAVDPERLHAHIPADRFDIPTFRVAGTERAFLSVVPFWDRRFRFPRIAPFVGLSFGQTNYRAYVVDRRTGEHAVWFFGTTLGSFVVQIPRLLWQLPWHSARYDINCTYDNASGRYSQFRFDVQSAWGDAHVELEDTGRAVEEVDGFATPMEAAIVLTHPIAGYYHRLDGRLGSYSIRHPKMALTWAEPRALRFEALERLGVLTREEASAPHSAWICPEIPFRILLPPHRLK
jgi:hypothetical protein